VKPALPETATAAPATDPVLEELDDWDCDWLLMKVSLEATWLTAGPFPTLTTTTFTKWVTF